MPDESTELSLKASRRKNYLFLALAIMVGMLAYDYRIARPSVDRAYRKIAERTVEVNNSPERSLTNTQVQELITKTPSRTFLDGRDLVEVYSWRSGLPVRTHDLFAVYKESIRGEQVFYRQAKFVYESSAEVAPIPVPMVIQMTPEQVQAFHREQQLADELMEQHEKEMRAAEYKARATAAEKESADD